MFGKLFLVFVFGSLFLVSIFKNCSYFMFLKIENCFCEPFLETQRATILVLFENYYCYLNLVFSVLL